MKSVEVKVKTSIQELKQTAVGSNFTLEDIRNSPFSNQQQDSGSSPAMIIGGVQDRIEKQHKTVMNNQPVRRYLPAFSAISQQHPLQNNGGPHLISTNVVQQEEPFYRDFRSAATVQEPYGAAAGVPPPPPPVNLGQNAAPFIRCARVVNLQHSLLIPGEPYRRILQQKEQHASPVQYMAQQLPVPPQAPLQRSLVVAPPPPPLLSTAASLPQREQIFQRESSHYYHYQVVRDNYSLIQHSGQVLPSIHELLNAPSNNL